jgi:hypothetical protein
MMPFVLWKLSKTNDKSGTTSVAWQATLPVSQINAFT